ncbi:MAG: S8 family peptidase, partial [Gemmatimonadota bacterium]
EPGADPRSAAAVAGVSPRYVYTAAVVGFAATLNAGQLAALRGNPAVEYVEQDQAAEAAITQNGAPWNLARIDPSIGSGTYSYSTTASGVYAYIIDTGISMSHPGFGGRAGPGYDAFGGNGQDCNGHGTHVAGIVGSTQYGVAKGVRLRSVRVLDCAGSGTVAGIVAGVDWVRVNRVNPAVANLSLTAPYSATLNTAVNNLSNSGVFVSVAAGNQNANACNYSPASAASALTLAASDSLDARAPYSNHGSCVDLYAPGSDVTSTWLNGGTRTLSGTSQAAPHAAGVAALYKATFGNASSATITSWIKTNALANVITGNPAGTPNLLLQKGTL